MSKFITKTRKAFARSAVTLKSAFTSGYVQIDRESSSDHEADVQEPTRMVNLDVFPDENNPEVIAQELSTKRTKKQRGGKQTKRIRRGLHSLSFGRFGQQNHYSTLKNDSDDDIEANEPEEIGFVALDLFC